MPSTPLCPNELYVLNLPTNGMHTPYKAGQLWAIDGARKNIEDDTERLISKKLIEQEMKYEISSWDFM